MCAMFGLESLENVWNSGLELWSGLAMSGSGNMMWPMYSKCLAKPTQPKSKYTPYNVGKNGSFSREAHNILFTYVPRL